MEKKCNKIEVNGIHLYYEVCGQGQPVLLVHGNGESHEIFDVAVEELQKTCQVYTIDSRCHGNSEKTKEISYKLMMEDTAAFIKKKNLKNLVFYGFSDGGILGLLLAIKEPELLSKLIISGANLNPEGLKGVIRLSMKLVYMLKKDPFYRMMLEEPDIKGEELEKIQIPVHVLAGERDMIREEHTRFLADHIPDSTLEILKKESHGSYIIHSPKLAPILKKYI